jgi:ParB family chromosome partitioning protein
MITYVGCLIKWYNEYLPIEDAEHQLNLEISENETRKDFSKAERIDYARRLERIERLKAEKRMKAGKADPSQNSDEGQRTDDTIAQKLGIGSRDTYRKEKYIVDNKDSLSPEDFADWDEGKLLRIEY